MRYLLILFLALIPFRVDAFQVLGSGSVTAAAPTCSDGIQNGDETGVDCGGSCDPCAGSPIVVEQYKTGSSTSSTLVITLDNATTSGSMLEVNCIQGDNGTITAWTVADNKSNSYNLIGRYTATNVVSSKLYTYNITGGSSHSITITRSAGSQEYACGVVEVSGLTTTDPLDKIAYGTAIDNTPVTPSTGVLSQNYEYASYSVGTRLTQIITTTPTPNGFVRLATQTTGGEWGALSLLGKTVSASTALTGDGTITSSTTWLAYLVTYKGELADAP